MKLLSTQENIYSLEVETGDEINIVFQPSEDMRIHLLNIGSIVLTSNNNRSTTCQRFIFI